MTKEELIDLVKKIVDAEGTEEEIHANILLLKQNVPHPSPTNLIYHEDLTAEEIVDKALSYKPFSFNITSENRSLIIIGRAFFYYEASC